MPRSIVLFLMLLVLVLPGCSDGSLPNLPELPGIPEALRDLPNLLQDLGLPDLSRIENLPELAELPLLQTPAGAIALSGPTERSLAPGDRLPGTDIELVSITPEGAQLRIDGALSTRALGDSLDYDGRWSNLPGSTYALRTRIYRIGEDAVRAAGVHRLVIADVAPAAGGDSGSGHPIRFPFTAGATLGSTFAGTTLGYGGRDERGARITGLAENEYAYRKVGDSLRWQGAWRPDIHADLNLRTLFYDEDTARVGGTVTLTLPSP